MKKVLLGTLAVLTLAACSKDEVIQQNPNDEISFSVTTNKAVSRAANGYCNKSLPENFVVWARHKAADASDYTSYFKGEQYDKPASGTTYTQHDGTKRYWPESGKLDFFALVNSKGTVNWNATNATGVLSVTGYQVEDDPANQKDFLYAVALDNTTKETTTLNFRHALSQIEFMAKNENKKIYVEISQVQVCNVNSKGDFTLPTVDTDPNVPEHNFAGTYPSSSVGTWANWSVLKDSYKTSEFITPIKISEREYDGDVLKDPSTPAAASGLTTKDDSGKEYSSNTMYLLPQGFQAADGSDANLTKVWSGSGKPTAGAYFLVKTKIWNVAASDGTRATATDVVLWGGASGKDIAVPVPADTNWEPGKRYVYTFVFTTSGNGGTDPTTGDPVLTPITLKVTVDDFVDGFTGTEGDITMTK